MDDRTDEDRADRSDYTDEQKARLLGRLMVPTPKWLAPVCRVLSTMRLSRLADRLDNWWTGRAAKRWAP